MQLSWDLLCQSMDKFHRRVNVSMTFCWKNDFKNIRKNVEKLFLGGPWRCPGTFPEPPGSRSGHFWRHGEDFGRIWSVPGTSQSTFGEPAGSSQDLKIDKIRTYGQKDGLGRRHRKRFSQILYADTVLDQFLVKNVNFEWFLDTFSDSKKCESRI